MEIIDKKKFAKASLDQNVKAFIVYIASLKFNLMSIHPASKAQIILLLAKKIKILTQYLDFLDVFLKEKALI